MPIRLQVEPTRLKFGIPQEDHPGPGPRTIYFPGIGSAAELAADILLFPGGLGPSHRGFVRFAKRALPGTNNSDGTYSCSFALLLLTFSFPGRLIPSTLVLGLLFLMFRVSVRRTGLILSVNGYPQGGCGSAASYIPELTIPFEHLAPELVT